jgi:hypothetical protein
MGIAGALGAHLSSENRQPLITFDHAQDLGEQRPRNANLGQLEREAPTVAHPLGADLDQLVAQRCQ